jgi:hypothetical protein
MNNDEISLQEIDKLISGKSGQTIKHLLNIPEKKNFFTLKNRNSVYDIIYLFDQKRGKDIFVIRDNQTSLKTIHHRSATNAIEQIAEQIYKMVEYKNDQLIGVVDKKGLDLKKVIWIQDDRLNGSNISEVTFNEKYSAINHFQMPGWRELE